MVPASIRRFMSSPPIDWMVRIGLVLSFLVTGVFAWRVQNLAACVARYNDANNERSRILTESAADERIAERRADDAQAALFLAPAVSKPVDKRTAKDRAEILRLFHAYQSALSTQIRERAQADDARRDHPVPDPPKDVCD